MQADLTAERLREWAERYTIVERAELKTMRGTLAAVREWAEKAGQRRIVLGPAREELLAILDRSDTDE